MKYKRYQDLTEEERRSIRKIQMKSIKWYSREVEQAPEIRELLTDMAQEINKILVRLKTTLH